MTKRLTKVPTTMVEIMAMASGLCSSEPMSWVNNSGIMAKMVVKEVMTMERKRRDPAAWMASSRATP